MRRAAVFAMLLWSLGAVAQAPDVATILTKVSDTFVKAKTYHFVGKAEVIRDGLPDLDESLQMEIVIRRQDRMRFSFQGKMLAIVNGDQISLVDAETGESKTMKRQPMPVDTGRDEDLLENTDRGFIIRYRSFASVPQLARLLPEQTIEADGGRHACYVLEIRAKITDPEANRAGESKGVYTWWVDKDRFIVLREDMRSADGKYSSSIVFSVAKVNEPLDESLFRVPVK